MKSERIEWSLPVSGRVGLIAALQALEDGRPVECMDAGDANWYDVDRYWLGDGATDITAYRIGTVQHPRERFINEYPTGFSKIHSDTREEAASFAGHDCIRTVRFIEVPEGEQ